ncbi:MAG: META domain-containing protein [Trueperaceae bacterium]|nr:META domain-containing protein [Trueperaceae bacterium]
MTRTLVRSTLLALALGAAALAAPPLLAPGPLPVGAWRLVGLDEGPTPWPHLAVTLEVGEDGRTVFGSLGCNTFRGEATGNADALDLGPLAQTLRACAGDEGTAEAIVARVLDAATRADLIAGRLVVRGAGRALIYAPMAAPEDAGVPGAPPLASFDRLDPSRFAAAVDASAANRAAWVRDPLQVALLFIDTPSSGRTTVVREDVGDGEDPDATVVRMWFDGLLDDAVLARWFEVALARGADGAWRVDAARQATWCARGDVTDALVAGVCP